MGQVKCFKSELVVCRRSVLKGCHKMLFDASVEMMTGLLLAEVPVLVSGGGRRWEVWIGRERDRKFPYAVLIG